MFGMLKGLETAQSFPVFCTLNLAAGLFTRAILNSEVKTSRKALKKIVVGLIQNHVRKTSFLSCKHTLKKSGRA